MAPDDSEDIEMNIFDIDCDELLMNDTLLCQDTKPEVNFEAEVSSFESVEHHLISCDHLWDEAGELAQKAFEDFTRKEKPKQVVCYQDVQKQKKKHDIKCPTLLQWIEENVEIVYN